MISFARDPSAAAEIDGRGRRSVNTAAATLGDLPQAAAEEEAAGDEAAAEAMGFRLSWSHPLAAALEETSRRIRTADAFIPDFLLLSPSASIHPLTSNR
jgi:hypothetical protein